MKKEEFEELKKQYEELKKQYEEEAQHRREVETLINDIHKIVENIDSIKRAKTSLYEVISGIKIVYNISGSGDGRSCDYEDEYEIEITSEQLLDFLIQELNLKREKLFELRKEYNIED